MDWSNKKQVVLLALATTSIVLCLLFFGRQVTADGAVGENRNPNFGQPAVKPPTAVHSTAGKFGDQSKDDYYQALKFNRPDLSDAELKAKTEHWWQIKHGDSAVSGG